jgi:elongation factor Ts
MQKISMDQVKELREATGISFAQCKKALEDAGGDLQKALAELKKKSADIAAKKSDRELGSSAVAAYVHATGASGAMVELSCETDFVSNNDEFKALARDIAMHITALRPQYVKKEDVPLADRERITTAIEEEVAASGKPKEVQQKIVEGKVDAILKEVVLLEQAFVKNPDLLIRNLIENAVQKFGENIQVARFARYGK